jgi:hypothetical protein
MLSVTDSSGIRISVTGNILGLEKPRSTWSDKFGNLGVSFAFLSIVFSHFNTSCTGIDVGTH